MHLFNTVFKNNCAKLFLQELRQISTNLVTFGRYGSLDAKIAQIVCYI